MRNIKTSAAGASIDSSDDCKNDVKQGISKWRRWQIGNMLVVTKSGIWGVADDSRQ